MKRRRARYERGYSLIEVLVAVTLLSIIASALATATIGSIRANGYSRSASEAMNLVQEQLEAFRAQSPTSLASLLPAGQTSATYQNTNPSNPINGMGEAGTADNPASYSRSWTVTRVTDLPSMLQIAVSVTWSAYGQDHTITNMAYYCTTTTC